MNRVIGVVPVKTFIIVVVGIGVLALAGFGAQAILAPESGFGPAGVAPRADYGLAAPSEGAAPALDTSGLERDLKDFVRGQISAQASAAPAPAADTSGLERDLKEVVREHMLAQANAEAAPAVDTSGLERDLKEVVWEHMFAQAAGGAALTVDTSGLERDLKEEIVQDRMAAGPQAQ